MNGANDVMLCFSEMRSGQVAKHIVVCKDVLISRDVASESSNVVYLI